MYELYVGVDPSINSTGVTVLIYNSEGEIHSQNFFVITGSKLTKKEKEAAVKYSDMFEYRMYEKNKVTDTMSNIEREYLKTMNFINIVLSVDNIVNEYLKKYNIQVATICQEGISYGSSIRTKSVFDLAGLNYMLRSYFIRQEGCRVLIATPSEIKKFATGSGVASKDLMLSMFKTYLLVSKHPDFEIPKMDDIADSFFMAKYAKETWKNYEKI